MRTNNGMSVVDEAGCIRRGVGSHRVLVRRGAQGYVLAWLVRQIHAGSIERAVTVYGWRSVKTNTAVGGSPRSDHLAGCAIDFNGGRHPWEARDPRGWSSGWTSADVAAIRELLAFTRGVVRWGLDYRRGDRDAMHFYTSGNGSRAIAVRAILKGTTPATVTSSTLNCRARPSTSSKIVRTRRKGSKITYRRIIWRNGRLWLDVPGEGYYAASLTSVQP